MKRRELGNPFFNSQNYQTFPYHKENFHQIERLETGRKICSIDGGNQEIYPTPEYSIQLNRIYFNIFKDKKRLSIKSDIPQRIEFLSLTTLNRDDTETFYETKLSIENEEYLKYLPLERDLQTTAIGSDFSLGNKILMERVSSMARRFAEWTIAEHIIDEEMDDGDIIIKDGSLQVAHANESKYAEQIFGKAKKKGVIFTGLSKTCRVTTDTGYSLIASVDKFAKQNDVQYPEWCYFPIAKSKREADHSAVVMVAKLNRDASTPFRFEILQDQADNMGTKEIMDVVSSIAEYSRDIILPGYPYGLFDAHVWARVRREDLEYYRMILDVELAKTDVYEDFSTRVKAVSMHDKLDEL